MITPGMLRIDAICGTGRPSISKPGSSSAGWPQNEHHVGQLRARLHGHPVAVALVVRRAQRHDLLADEAGHHLLVPLEAAAGEHDAARAPMSSSPSAVLHAYADDRAVDDDELLGRGCRSGRATPRSSRPLKSDAASAAPSTRMSLACRRCREVGVRQVAAGEELAALLHGQPRQVRPDAHPRGPLAELGARRRTAPARASVPPACRRAGRRSSRRSREAPTSAAGSWSRGSRASRRRCRRRSRPAPDRARCRA